MATKPEAAVTVTSPRSEDEEVSFFVPWEVSHDGFCVFRSRARE